MHIVQSIDEGFIPENIPVIAAAGLPETVKFSLAFPDAKVCIYFRMVGLQVP